MLHTMDVEEGNVSLGIQSTEISFILKQNFKCLLPPFAHKLNFMLSVLKLSNNEIFW